MTAHDSLCKYKDVLGEPAVGFHTHVFGIAILDVLLTALLAIPITNRCFKSPNVLSYMMVYMLLIIFATFIHYIFCVPTVITTNIGLV